MTREGLASVLALAAVAVLVLPGCGASAEPTFYALAQTPGAARAGQAKTIELRTPGIAGYLDRPGIVSGVTDYQLRFASGARWGEPLGDMVGRVLAADLTQRLPGSTVFTQASAISAVPDAFVDIQVQRFDVGKEGSVTIEAQVAVSSANPSRQIAETVSLQRRPEGGTASLVATMSALLGEVADRIAALLHERLNVFAQAAQGRRDDGPPDLAHGVGPRGAQ